MAARFVMLAFAAFSLAACETASDDASVHRGASPTLGDLGHHPRAVRGPVVADSDVVAPSHATRAAGTRLAISHAASTRTAHVVPNPMRAAKSNTTAPAVSATTTARSAVPTEPVQPASATDQPTAPPASDAQSTIGAYPASDPSALPVTEPVQHTAPISFGLGELTPAKIEAMFGGMPFLLIASIAAALVASLGLALRSSAPAKREEYAEPHVDHEDYREPYAA
jgi:hypothetical protein